MDRISQAPQARKAFTTATENVFANTLVQRGLRWRGRGFGEKGKGREKVKGRGRPKILSPAKTTKKNIGEDKPPRLGEWNSTVNPSIS